MALKADRQVDAYELGYFLNETAEKGVFVSVSTAGSGVGLDATLNVATVAADSSGSRPLGVLLNDFVNIDVTKQYLNYHKDESVIGSKATIMTNGWVVTNKITGDVAAGDIAILSSSGTVAAATNDDFVENVNAKVGSFRSAKNEDGYARVYVDL